jgi:predicted Zn-dependent peptidase
MDAPIAKSVLANGIRILSKKMAHVRSVSMGVWVNAGARDESAAENGLSHFIEHMIFKGTPKRSAFQIAKEFDAIGGHSNAFTAMETTCYHGKVMDTHLETMVDILTDIFLNSLFDEREIERERPVILQEIGMVEDSPDEYVHVLTGKNFWGDHSLGQSILGKPDNILRFDTRTITSFFHRLYQPERIMISVAGNVDHSRFVDLIGPSFEAIQSGDGFPLRWTPVGRSLVDITYRELEQVHICLGARGLSIADPRRYAFSLLNTILGGNMSSRLFQEIREQRGLAYSVYSFISSHADTGMFGICTAVDPSRAYESIALILAELRKLATEPVGLDELEGAKEYLKGSLLLASESTDNQMVRTAQNEINFGQDVLLEEVLDAISKVTADDILTLTRDLSRENLFALTMLGPVEDKTPFEKLLFDPN